MQGEIAKRADSDRLLWTGNVVSGPVIWQFNEEFLSPTNTHSMLSGSGCCDLHTRGQLSYPRNSISSLKIEHHKENR